MANIRKKPYKIKSNYPWNAPETPCKFQNRSKNAGMVLGYLYNEPLI